MFENKVLRRIFGAKRDEVAGDWRKLHNAELHALYSSPDIIRNIKSRRLRWAWHEALECNHQLRMDVYAVFHQCAGDEETHRLESADKVEQTLCGEGDFCFETVAGVILRRFISILGYLASEWDERDNAGEMSPGSSTESYPAFPPFGLRENPEKPKTGNLPQPEIELGPPGFAARRANRYSTGVVRVHISALATLYLWWTKPRL
ncbi:hypothetical protein ANN_02590 [Periplaneta americana]|uniref:Uncharacterized protein n=1 Tax=Periplaneta americana TaxID=6978 RepID=A0ABQ8TXW6_PERAM|nr:hypothetical protein ANN_02590 [Periplaneta americana]